METVKEILQAKGIESVEEMEPGDCYTIDGNGYMDLTIEKVWENQISVAHYYKQFGDLMRDPEIVFEIQENGDWLPIRYRQDPYKDEYKPGGIRTAKNFARKWDRNLKQQGFIDRAQQEVKA